AGIGVIALITLVVLFALPRTALHRSALGKASLRRRRSTRVDPGAGAATDSGPSPILALGSDRGAAELGAPPAVRSHRRARIPAIRRAEPADEPRLAEIEAQSQPGLEGSGLGALPVPALREGDGPAPVLFVAGRPAVAYIRIDEIDGAAHVDQLVVLSSVA